MAYVAGAIGTCSITNLVTSEQRDYGIDTSFEPYRREAFRSRSQPAQREGISQSNIPGQGTLTTEGLWRREQTEWSLGAGQYSLDRKGEDQSTRFSFSKGVDVFSFPLQAKLLPDTHEIIANAGTNLIATRCNGLLVVAGGGTVKYYSNAAGVWSGTPTTCTIGTAYGGSAWSIVYSITSNDTYVYIATDTGIWFCNIGQSGGSYITPASAFELYAAPDGTTGYTGGYSLIRWCNDQLIAAQNNRLYAFQPRVAGGLAGVAAPFGAPPVLSPINVSISGIGTTPVTDNATAISAAGGIVTVTVPNAVTPGEIVSMTGFTTVAYNEANKTVLTATSTQITYASASTGATSTGTVTVNIAYLSTTVAHGASVGQSITVQGSVASEQITAATLSSGTLTVTTGTSSHGLQVGETVTTTIATAGVPNGRTETAVVAAVAAHNQYAYRTAKWGAAGIASFSSGVFYGQPTGNYGYNGNWIIKAIGSPTSITLGGVSTAAGDFGAGGTVLSTVNTSSDMLVTHPNPNWTWSDATQGQTQVYFAGYVKGPNSNGSGGVYRSDMLGSTTTNSANTTQVTGSSVNQPWQLNIPVQALPMSPDEYPTCIQSYLNFIFVGTNRGIRMCQTLSIYDPTATATGDLKSGPIIPNILQPITSPITAIVGDGRYVWWSWNNYDGSSTGLGKLDLTTNISQDPLTPAYASDLMYAGAGVINSLVWDPYNNAPLAAVQGQGVFQAYATNLGQGGQIAVTKYVASGTITSGIFDYGITERKIPLEFDYVAANSTSSSVSASVIFDPGDALTSTQAVASYASGGTSNVNFNTTNYVTAHQFQTTVTLTAGTSALTSPILHRWTLKSWPCVVQGTDMMAVLKVFIENEEDEQEYDRDVYAEFIWLENLRLNQTIIQYNEGELSFVGVVKLIDRIPHSAIGDYRGGFQGDLVVTMQTLTPFVYLAAGT